MTEGHTQSVHRRRRLHGKQSPSSVPCMLLDSALWGELPVHLKTRILSCISSPLGDATINEYDIDGTLCSKDTGHPLLNSLVPATLRGMFLPDGRFVCATRLPIFDSSVGLEASTSIPVPEYGQLWVFRESRGELQVSMWIGCGDVPDHCQCLARGRPPLIAEFLTGHASHFWINMGEIINQPLNLVDPRVAVNREMTK